MGLKSNFPTELKAGLLTVLLALFILSGTACDAAKKKQTTTKEDAIQKAVQYVQIHDPQIFTDPHIDQAVLNNHAWIIKILSSPPQAFKLGEAYIYISVDADTGAVKEINTGGGS